MTAGAAVHVPPGSDGEGAVPVSRQLACGTCIIKATTEIASDLILTWSELLVEQFLLADDLLPSCGP